MTDFEKMQIAFNNQVKAVGEDEAYNLCYIILKLPFLKLLMDATRVSLEEFGKTYYSEKQAPLEHANEYVKNLSYSQLSYSAVEFTDELRRIFTTRYPKPDIMTTLISYNTVTDFFCVYVCVSIGLEMLKVLHHLAEIPFLKRSRKLFREKVEIPIFPEFDQYTMKQLKELNLVNPFTMAAWEVFPKEIIPDSTIRKACDLSWNVIEIVMASPNTTIAELKKKCLDIYRNQADYLIKNGVENLYDTLFHQIRKM